MTTDIITTPIGRFRVKPTRPNHAELESVDGPITVHGVAYVIRGEFRVADSWTDAWRPGYERIEHQEPYAHHIGGYAICRHREGERWPDCRTDGLTDKARDKIGRAIGPALKDYLASPEVRADAIDAERQHWVSRWQSRADYYRDEAARLLQKAAEAERGARAIAEGGPFAEPPAYLLASR